MTDEECVLNIKLVKDLLTEIISDVMDTSSNKLYYSFFPVDLKIEILGLQHVYKKLNNCLSITHLDRYINIDFNDYNSIYGSIPLISLSFKKEYISEIKEIITMYRLMRE